MKPYISTALILAGAVAAGYAIYAWSWIASVLYLAALLVCAGIRASR